MPRTIARFALLIALLVNGPSCAPRTTDLPSAPSDQSANEQRASDSRNLSAAKRPSDSDTAEETPHDSANQRRPDAPAQDTPAIEDVWDVCRIQGDKVGHVRTRVTPVQEQGQTLERIDMEHVIVFRRFGQEIRQELQLTSWETPQGELVRFESRVQAGREITLTRGSVQGNKLRMESTTPGKTVEQTIDWKPEWGGFHATERALRGSWKPKQRRVVQALVPVLHQVGKTELTADGYEAVRIEGVSHTLLKIRKVDILGPTRIESTVWIDERGEPLRSFIGIPAPGMETVRSTREAAIADAPTATFDLGESTTIPVSGMPQQPHSTSLLRYRATLPDGEIERVFATGASQSVQRLDATHAEITVRAVRPSSPPSDPPESGPDEAERRANGFIQSDDPAVVAFSREAVPDESDPWKVAVAIESLVRQRVRARNFTQAMATAAEVVRSGEGDCTEHAVLLAAACRARGIPTRVAIGLVYVPTLQGFAYHMWNEVWIQDRWIPLDATLAQGGIGGGHLKLLTTSLDGVDAYAAFLPVFQVLGRLRLEVIP